MQQDLQYINKLKALMDKLNADFNAYREEAIISAGWENKDARVSKVRLSFVQSLGELNEAVLPEAQTNAKELCDLYFHKPVGIDDIDAAIMATTLPCDKSNSN